MRVIGNDRSHLVIETACRGYGRALSASVLTVLLAVFLGLAWAPTVAHALTISAVMAPTSSLVNATATYGCTAKTQGNETISSATFTFPHNTILAGATITAVERGGHSYVVTIVSRDETAGLLTCTMTVVLSHGSDIVDIRVTGVVNASQPGAYSYGVTLGSSDGSTVGPIAAAYALAANPSALTVDAITAAPATELLPAAYTIPVTVGADGRLASDAAAGPNTISLSFPASFTVPTSPPAKSVTINGVAVTVVAVAGQTVTLQIPAGVSIPSGGTATIALSPSFGLTNPPTGTYAITASTSAQTGTGTSPTFTIQVAQYLTMTIDMTNVDFDAVDPGVTSTPRAVRVTVHSSAGFTISRVFSGDVGLLGLVVTGAADGAKGAGLATYADSYTITPPWTTTPDMALKAQVQYTAVQ